MPVADSSFEYWSSTFEQSSIEELVVHCIELGFPSRLEKLGALHQRFIDIAFHSKDVLPNVRSIAASWAHALESVAIVSFSDHPHLLKVFMNAREVNMKHAIEYGYGSPLYMASVDGEQYMERLLGAEETPESLQVKGRRDYLRSSAFGRFEDSAQAATSQPAR